MSIPSWSLLAAALFLVSGCGDDGKSQCDELLGTWIMDERETVIYYTENRH